MKIVPTYRLYGERSSTETDFWLHCETIFSRSSLYRFEIDNHRHESFLQILYISDGTGDAVLDGVVHPIKAPSAIVVTPQVNHGFRFSRDIVGWIVTVLPAALSPGIRAMLRQTLMEPCLLPLGERAAAETAIILDRLADEFGSRRKNRGIMMEAYLSALLVHLSRLSRETPSRADTALSANEERMERLYALIAGHFRSQQPMDFYAEQLDLSPTHLNRIVRLETGLTLQGLIARRLVESAKQELIFGHATVQAIALNLGFRDPAYFSRFFVRETGMTPRAWRAAERQNLQSIGDHDGHGSGAAE